MKKLEEFVFEKLKVTKNSGSIKTTVRKFIAWFVGEEEFRIDKFDIEMLKAVHNICHVPVIASGGCGSLYHFEEVFKEDCAEAALAASLFHYKELSVMDVKKHLEKEGIPVRL